MEFLEDLIKVFGNRRVVLARELTKKFEEYVRGYANEVLEVAGSLKGEMVVIVEGNSQKEETITEEDLVSEIKQMMANLSSKEIVAILTDKYNLKKNYVYDLVCKNK